MMNELVKQVAEYMAGVTTELIDADTLLDKLHKSVLDVLEDDFGL